MKLNYSTRVKAPTITTITPERLYRIDDSASSKPKVGRVADDVPYTQSVKNTQKTQKHLKGVTSPTREIYIGTFNVRTARVTTNV